MKNPTPSTIKVDIFNTEYSIKPTDSLTEDDIRALADYVDQMMRQMSEKGYDKVSGAILVALNIAGQMYKEQKQIRQLIRMIDETMVEDFRHDLLQEASPFNRKSPLRKRH